MLKRSVVLFLVVCGVLVGCASSAWAETPAPGFNLMGVTTPTDLPPGGEGVIKLYAFNHGAAASEGGLTLTDMLPEGLTATKVYADIEHSVSREDYVQKCSIDGSRLVTCTMDAINPNGFAYMDIAVKVSAGASTADYFEVGGGGTLNTESITVPLSYGSGPAGPGFSGLAGWVTNANGTADTQAGSHPYDLAVAFGLNENLTKPLGSSFEDEFGESITVPAGGNLRTINVNLPPGIVGDPQAVPQCTRAVFDLSLARDECPPDAQVGEDQFSIEGATDLFAAPIYNLVPPPGVAAQFAMIVEKIPVFFDSGVRTGGDNGITTRVENIPQRDITFNEATLWGIPAEKAHDVERCYGVSSKGKVTPECEMHEPATPFLTLPTWCGTPPEFTAPEFTAELLGTWEHENFLIPPSASTVLRNQSNSPYGLTGCERLQPFKPTVSIAPDTTYADTPAGLSVDVRMPQGLNPEGLQTPNLKDTTVVLPEGLAINPGQATGLLACQPAEEELGRELNANGEPDGEVNQKAAKCPSASKVGTDEIESPLLRDKLQGNVYILTPNPPNLQLLVTASGDGVNLKLVGNVHLNETTGQLTTTFENTPDLPFTEFRLAFSGGAQAALATPTSCGTFQSSAVFTPWGTPFVSEAFESSRFQITSGPLGTPCVGPMPFSPTLTAGATTDQAGGYTSFTMLLQRGDEQQRIKNLSFKTPEGLLGMIAKVPLCEEPQAAQGTCPAASQIGHTVVGTGPGPYPFYIPQASAPPAPIYLTGPYKGAPFGLSIVVPLIAGPFNLGTEIVRATITVDPYTSQITVTTDPLPQVVKGIPTDLRSIDAVIDRPEFMFNPTSCAPMSFSGTATSVEGATASLGSHFQVGSCQALKFAPDFKVSTSGKTSRATGASLNVKIIYPTGNLGDNQASSQSNVNSIKVDLPKQLPSQLKTLQKACPAATYDANPANCPPASIVGHAKATTPVLPVPLEGPAYFVSHGDEAFPNLVVVLQGYGVTVELVGDTFINEKTSITSSTFKNVPDVPISLFELNLPQGKYPALAANGNLCKTKLTMPTAFTAQNGAVIHQSTPISVTGCPKAKKAKKTKATHKHPKGNKKKK